jgi:hypothetical protein
VSGRSRAAEEIDALAARWLPRAEVPEPAPAGQPSSPWLPPEVAASAPPPPRRARPPAPPAPPLPRSWLPRLIPEALAQRTRRFTVISLALLISAVTVTVSAALLTSPHATPAGSARTHPVSLPASHAPRNPDHRAVERRRHHRRRHQTHVRPPGVPRPARPGRSIILVSPARIIVPRRVVTTPQPTSSTTASSSSAPKRSISPSVVVPGRP